MRENSVQWEWQLGELAREVAQVRAQSGRRSAVLPGELWERIVAVAQEVGVNRASEALGLWYYAVKKRVVARQEWASGGEHLPAVSAARRAAVSFVELPASVVAPRPGCVIEMRRGDGASVTVSLAGVEHVTAVARSFLGVGA